MINLRDVVISSGGIQAGTRQADTTGTELLGVGADIASGLQAQKDERDSAAFNIEAQTDLQLFGVEALEQARVGSERPDDITKNFLETYENRYQELKQKSPNDTAAKQLEQNYQRLRASLGTRAMGVQVSEVQAFRKGAVLNARDANRNALLNGQISYEMAQANDQMINGQLAPFISNSERLEQQRKAKHDTASINWGKRSQTEQYAIWANSESKGGGSFAAAQELVFENEGGFTAIDGASGAPAIFGLNRKWHKEAHDRVKEITEQRGEAAGKKAAAEYYKSEFWDKNNIGSLPKNTRMVVYDGAVNHHAGFVKRLVNKAKEGATPEQLLAMREKEYRRLGGYDKHKPALQGWLNRLDKVQAATFGGTGTEFDDLSLTGKIRANSQMQSFERDMRNTMKSDAGKYAEVMGLDDTQSIALQGGRTRAALLSHDSAKEIVENANTLETTDQVYEMASQLKDRGGENYDLLMRDLRKQKLNPRVESAINLANEDPATYKRHIELMMDSYQMDKNVEAGAKLNGSFKAAGHNKASFESAWNGETEELMGLMLREGVDPNHVTAEMTAYKQLAMAHAVKNTGGDLDDSIEFALQPLLNGYSRVSLNGETVRVPDRVKGEAFDSSIAQRRLGFAYDSLVGQIRDDRKSKGEVFDDDTVFATLNPDASGLWLRGPLGEPEINTDTGKPYEINFANVIREFTPEEIDISDRESLAKRLRENIPQQNLGE